jgi:hypothetical protein
MIEGAVRQKSRNQCEIAAKLPRIRSKTAEKSHRIVSISAAGQKNLAWPWFAPVARSARSAGETDRAYAFWFLAERDTL